MILSLISAVLGLFGSAMPSLIGIYQDKQDKAHELAVMQMQMTMQSQGHTERLEEINTQADVTETEALYKTYNTGITWVDTLNGTVRPVIAYGFFILYATLKILTFSANLPWLIWTDEDHAVFVAIISFYFGNRAISKYQSGK